ncbi:hypothetical protein DACRYDRAFT_92302 [Dacryopinax primogenitus]|uniref:Tim17-domain-containing protein n=1 Tax=Dacryopinax primogenitus (strain DJM 731) TaxID=1858805 RepID=M5GGW5_DACPD|nr:uncharacterized protein DACRYDRAFT_92302 [Dacryopinax primogenitus]EJU06198.1 hypothetical protein DACRYDRAFT_92302 [Dacryopinax primogenitus]
MTTPPEAGPSSGLTLEERKARAIHLPDIPKEDIVIPGLLFALGAMTGCIRGGRMAGLRFAAENTHRAPTTMEGWYFYQKTKNYRVILGSIKGGAWRGLQLGGLGCLYVGWRDVGQYAGMKEWADILAGVGSGVVVSAVYRMPRRQVYQMMVLGAGFGLTTSLGRKFQVWMKEHVGEVK